MPMLHIDREQEPEVRIQYAPFVTQRGPPQADDWWKPPPPPVSPRQRSNLQFGVPMPSDFGVGVAEAGRPTWTPTAPSRPRPIPQTTPVIATFGTNPDDEEKPECISALDRKPMALPAPLPSESAEQRLARLTAPSGLPTEDGWVQPPETADFSLASLGISSLARSDGGHSLSRNGGGDGAGPNGSGGPRQPGAPPPMPPPRPAEQQADAAGPELQLPAQMPMIYEPKCEASWHPQELVCPHCKQDVTTEIQHDMGSGSYALCICGCCCGLGVLSWLGLLPCCIKSCQDAHHHCPKCQAELGTKVFLC